METIVSVGEPRKVQNWTGQRRRMVIGSFVTKFGSRDQMHFLESAQYSDAEPPKTVEQMAQAIYDNIPPEHREMLSFSVSTPFTVENIKKICVLQETIDFLIKDENGVYWSNNPIKTS